MTKTNEMNTNKGLLAWIERVGNKMPHPLAIFSYLTVGVIVLSAICSAAGWSAIHPATGAEIVAVNLLSISGLLLLLKTFISNFQTVSILGSIIVFCVVCGYCERTGLFTSAIKMGLKNARGSFVVFFIALIGCFSNQAGDVAFIIVPTLAAAIFIGMGRNPIAGIFCGYASVGGGFGTELIPAFLSSVLTPVSVEAAQMIQPGFEMSPLNAYYGLFASAIVVSLMTTLVTVKVIEPRLGTYNLADADASIDIDAAMSELTPEQISATKKAGLSLLIYFLVLVVLCIPSNSFFRGEGGTLLTGSPLMDSVIGLLVLMFFIPGVVYGIATKQLRNMKDMADMAIESVKGISPFIVLCIIIGQFLALFNASNLATLFAIGGGQALQATSLPTYVIVILFTIFVMFVNLFMYSSSVKYLIFGPVFVPLLMQLNIHPSLTQMAYRIGDCCTNSLTPLNAAFLICLTMCQKYNKNIGMGNLFSSMFAYSVAYAIALIAMLFIWMTLGLPMGPTGGIWLS